MLVVREAGENFSRKLSPAEASLEKLWPSRSPPPFSRMESLGIHSYPNKFVREKFPVSCSSKQEQGTLTPTCGTKLSRGRLW